MPLSPILFIKSRKRLFIGAGIVAGVLLIVPFLIPLDRYIPQIEQLASEQVGDPVRIASLRVFMLPTPHLTIEGIEVGRKTYLSVRKVTVTPRLLSLFAEQKVIRRIGVYGADIGPPMMDRLQRLAAKPAGAGAAPVRVERIAVRDAELELSGLRMKQVDLDLDLGSDGSVEQARLRADKGALDVMLTPRGKAYSVGIVARNWKLPVGPPLLLGSLDASGTMNATGLTLPSIQARIYDGSVKGQLAIGWKPDWSIKGELDIQGVDIQPVVALFTRETTISGKLNATPAIDMRAASAGQLAQALNIESGFKVENGTLYDMDLSAAPKALVDKDAIKGGQTRFDQFSGDLIVDPEGYHLINLKVTSGVLKAQGELSISPAQELSGVIDVSVKGTSALISTPLAVTGTVQDPFLYPSKLAMAGAAAGTALLGPGLGTTVGMKAFGITGKLFGRKKKIVRSAPVAGETAKPAPEAQAAPVQKAKTPLPEPSGRR